MSLIIIIIVLAVLVGAGVMLRTGALSSKWGRRVAVGFLSLLAATIALLVGGALTSAILQSAGVDYDTANVFAAGTAIVAAAVTGIMAFRWYPRVLGKRLPVTNDRAAVASPANAVPPRTQSSTPDVFISYKRDERPQVAAIARRLAALKLSVWFDAEMRSGTTFDAEIDKKVRAAKCVLVCWSPGAVASDWVRGEATIGRGRGVLCAAMLLACDLPAPFNLVHANDLTAGIGPANSEWLAVLESIGALIARPGLAEYERLETSRDPAAYGAWIARYPNDPLAESVVARLKLLSA